MTDPSPGPPAPSPAAPTPVAPRPAAPSPPAPSPRRSKSFFLGRRSYRQRRFRDLARVLPVAGGVLLTLPLLWPRAGGTIPAAETSSALIYLFGVWMALIVAAFTLSVKLGSSEPERDEERLTEDMGPADEVT